MLKSHYRDNLSEFFYTESKPENTKNLDLVVENASLLDELNIEKNLEELVKDDENSIAQAYAGFQFGYFSILGDGRAHLLGEIEYKEDLYDISLKGSGRTPYSRNGDGKARLGPMLREHLISEFLNSIDVPTSRSLGVFKTNQTIIRDGYKQGAILVRLMKSHIRGGTFQYAYHVGGQDKLEEILNYTIDRLYPGLTIMEFFKEVIDRQAKLVAKWMAAGFIHGVLNTDNMSITGEGFDYGPCAFIDEYDPKTVYSSIDRNGRYAYGNQANITGWNLARFGDTLLESLAKDGYIKSEVEEEINKFYDYYNAYYREEMGKRLGINDMNESDDQLLQELLSLLEKEKIDYHNFFIDLSEGNVQNKAFDEWLGKWGERQNTTIITPQIIPRNHLVQKAVDTAEDDDYDLFFDLLDKFQNPYEKVDSIYQEPMPKEMATTFKTYCGT